MDILSRVRNYKEKQHIKNVNWPLYDLKTKDSDLGRQNKIQQDSRNRQWNMTFSI